jgi:hypothetical protein
VLMCERKVNSILLILLVLKTFKSPAENEHPTGLLNRLLIIVQQWFRQSCDDDHV